MVNKNGWGAWVFFWSLLVIMLVVNFVRESFGLSYLYWVIFIHGGVICFCFLIIILSLKLNDKAMKYIILGSIITIIVESIFFLSNIFTEYYFLSSEGLLHGFLGIGSLLLMKGFLEGSK